MGRDHSIEEARARRLAEIRSRIIDVDNPWDSRHYPTPPPAHRTTASTNLEFQRPSRSGRPHGTQASTSTSNSDGRYMDGNFSALSSEAGPSTSRSSYQRYLWVLVEFHSMLHVLGALVSSLSIIEHKQCKSNT